ncbi:MAG: hypothetical protein C0592_09535, partial [Marinilabiliales bacterium]
IPFIAFLSVAIMFPERVALLAGVGWISALLFVTVFASRYVATVTSFKDILWEFLSIIAVAISIIIRENRSIETYFIEVTLIELGSLVIGLLFFQTYKMISIDKGEWNFGAILIVVLIVGYPIYYVTRCFILGWFELNTIHQDPTPFVLLLTAVISNIIREIRFFGTLLKGKTKYEMNFLENNKWMIAVILGGWIIIVPLVAWLIR